MGMFKLYIIQYIPIQKIRSKKKLCLFIDDIDDTDDVEKDNDDQEIIQKLKLNHGLFLYSCGMQPSKQAIYNKGELDISLYDGQPLVYTKYK